MRGMEGSESKSIQEFIAALAKSLGPREKYVILSESWRECQLALLNSDEPDEGDTPHIVEG